MAYLQSNSDSEQSLFLAYSAKRDFLSVPLTYSVIKFSCPSVLEIHQMGLDEYLDGFEEDVSIPVPGFYRFEANDDGADEDENDEFELDIIVLVQQNSVVEITYKSMDIMSEVYHCVDAKTALINALANN